MTPRYGCLATFVLTAQGARSVVPARPLAQTEAKPADVVIPFTRRDSPSTSSWRHGPCHCRQRSRAERAQVPRVRGGPDAIFVRVRWLTVRVKGLP